MPTRTFAWEELADADLVVDACYQGRRQGNAGDDPLHRLVGVSNQGGFRILGTVEQPRLIVLTSSQVDPDWPDRLDEETGTFQYFGDNKNPGAELHDTRRWGNRLLRQNFSLTHSGVSGRRQVPPFLIFSSAGTWRDVIFRGLAVPGVEGLSQIEDLVAVWKSKSGQRFQNYRALFTILNAPVVRRAWLDDLKAGKAPSSSASSEYLEWVESGTYLPLLAKPSIEIRSKREQLPSEPSKKRLLGHIRSIFSADPFAFEHFAARIARLHLGSVTSIDITQPRRDGGRDAVGLLRLGRGPSSILIDFAVEAKCWNAENSVGVRELSRLISRLRHRQFGVMVTTSYVHSQAYTEIKEDRHPIIIIAGGDIVDILIEHGMSTPELLDGWINSPVR